MNPKKADTSRPQDDSANAGDTAPMDHDSHGNDIKRVPGPGPKDEGKGAAGEDALEQLKRK